jgi:tetratricopeptide (TPR) repeat protein
MSTRIASQPTKRLAATLGFLKNAPFNSTGITEGRRAIFHKLAMVACVMISLQMFCLVIAACIAANPGLVASAQVALFPSDCNALLYRADYSLKMHDLKFALADCDRALLISPNNQTAFRLKSQICFDSGNYNAALNYINLADPTNVATIRLKANILFRQGDLRAAGLYPLQVWSSSKSPLNASDALNAGYALACTGDYKAAVFAVNKALSVAANDQDLCAAYTQKARYLLRLNQFEKAEADAARAIAFHQNDGAAQWDAYLYRGEARLALQNYAGALDDANSSISLNQADGRQLRLRANAYIKLGCPENASNDARLAEFCKVASADI